MFRVLTRHAARTSGMQAAVRLASNLSDSEILEQLRKKKIKFHELEAVVPSDLERAVRLRRTFVEEQQKLPKDSLAGLPFKGYEYGTVLGANCENVVGYVPIPIGIAGPLLIDGVSLPIPMATTEGALVASTHRGARALNESGGVTTAILGDGMTRGPVVRFSNLKAAQQMKEWVQNTHFAEVAKVFNGTSRFAKLESVSVMLVGRTAYLRFRSRSGDAMGMNMVTKATNAALDRINAEFPDMKVIALSGNVCVDKKPSAMNWVNGRGKSVTAEAVIPNKVVKEVLKSDVATIAQVNTDKNLVGSAMAGSIGGFNAHAANVVAAVFIACGQDPAQVVASSTCMTIMEPNANDSLYVSITMPSIEVGTVGGGTGLSAQKTVLQMLGIQGAHPSNPGQNSTQLARLVCSAVMAGELSLMAGLAAGHLTRAHMKLNRKSADSNENKPH